MAIMTRCCFCCSLRTGSVVAGFYTMVSSALLIALFNLRYIRHGIAHSDLSYEIAVYSTIAFFSLLTVSSLLLMLAAYKKIRGLLIPWIVVAALCILQGSGVMTWILVLESRKTEWIHPWEVGLVIYHIINSIILCYSLVVVLCHYQDLIRSKQTRQQHSRRQTQRHGPRPRSSPSAGSGPYVITTPSGERLVPGALQEDNFREIFPIEPPAYLECPPPYTPRLPDQDGFQLLQIPRLVPTHEVAARRGENAACINLGYEDHESAWITNNAADPARTSRGNDRNLYDDVDGIYEEIRPRVVSGQPNTQRELSPPPPYTLNSVVRIGQPRRHHSHTERRRPDREPRDSRESTRRGRRRWTDGLSMLCDMAVPWPFPPLGNDSLEARFQNRANNTDQ